MIPAFFHFFTLLFSNSRTKADIDISLSFAARFTASSNESDILIVSRLVCILFDCFFKATFSLLCKLDEFEYPLTPSGNNVCFCAAELLCAIAHKINCVYPYVVAALPAILVGECLNRCVVVTTVALIVRNDNHSVSFDVIRNHFPERESHVRTAAEISLSNRFENCASMAHPVCVY